MVLQEPGERGQPTPSAEPAARKPSRQLDHEHDRGLAPPSESVVSTTTRLKSLPAHRSSARTSEPGLRGLHALSLADWDRRPELDTATVAPSELDFASVMTARSLEMKLLPAIWVIAANGTGPAGLDAAEEPTQRTSDSDSEETTADRTSSRSRSHASLTTLTQVPHTLPARSSDRLVSTWSVKVNPSHG